MYIVLLMLIESRSSFIFTVDILSGTKNRNICRTVCPFQHFISVLTFSSIDQSYIQHANFIAV